MKTIVITGAMGGIGQATVHQFLKQDVNVVAVDLLPVENSNVTSFVSQYPDRFAYFNADCTDESSVENLIKSIVERFSTIDVLFNIAGGSGRRFGDGPVHLVPLEGFKQTLDLNLTGTFLMCKHGVGAMLKQETGGCIINTSSVLGLTGGNELFGTHAYAAAKAAIIGLSRAMAITYAKQHIRVNVIAPGLMQTPMSRRAQNDAAILAYMDEKQPIYAGRNQLGDPKAVAKAAEFLASDEADFITGIVLPVDGGWTAQ